MITSRWLPRILLVLLVIGPFGLPAQALTPLAPGDRITLRLPGENTASEIFEVDHRGVLTLPRIGAISAVQTDPAVLADSIRALYKQLFADADVTVLLTRRITVLGEVKKPGVLYLNPSSTIRDAVAMAEGATEFADISHINLIRGDDRQRIDEWTTASASTTPLRSGDSIMFDRESWIRRNVPSLLGALGILASIAVALSR